MVCLRDVEGAYSKVPFYHLFSSFDGFCVVYGVFGSASLYDTNYRCVVGMSVRFVGARCVD
jgi:hypothetical protein